MLYSKLNYVLAGLGMLLVTATATAQTGADSIKYNHNEVFGPITWPVTTGGTRSANGQPGHNYWQNRADYQIRAALNEGTSDTTVTGEVTISYTNNSPDNLDYLWLQLDQNLFRPDSRGAATVPIGGDRFDVKGFNRGGYQIESVSVTYKGQTYKVEPVITDARMQLRLKTPMGARGEKVAVKVNYSFSVPFYGADRMGRKKFKDGYVYEIAQWYPRMCVYDDVEGWNTLPYMGLGEFYCDYGDFDYYITAPANMTVVGSGDLENGAQVLTATQQHRLAEARTSDKTVMIIKPEEINSESTHPFKGTRTWHFKMLNTRDVSWAASKAFIWDAARVNFPSGRKGIAMSTYPVESSGHDSWGRSTEYLKYSMEIYSDKYFEYPWNSAVSVSGVALGMEYPGIIFCLSNLKNGGLWGDITHEIGHNWFPMIVGSDERRYGWMDEGLNTFIDIYAHDEFNKGEYAPKRDGEYAPKGGNPANEVLTGMLDPNAITIMTPADGVTEKFRHPITYFKTSFGLVLLREQILGPERFDYAFRNYINKWAYKHPQPEDFFRSIDNGAGEDLAWFWRGWFYNNYKLDLALVDAKYINGDPKRGLQVTIANKEAMAMPFTLEVKLKDGSSQRIKFPVETWLQQHAITYNVPTTTEVESVTIDPDNALPDVNRSNNSMKVK